jgi:hypothetical protein
LWNWRNLWNARNWQNCCFMHPLHPLHPSEKH